MTQQEKMQAFLTSDQWKPFNRVTLDELPLWGDPLSLLFDSDTRAQCDNWLLTGGDDPTDYAVIAGCCFVEGSFESEAMFVAHCTAENCPVYFSGAAGLSDLTPIAPSFDAFITLLTARRESFAATRATVQAVVAAQYNEHFATALPEQKVLNQQVAYDDLDPFMHLLSVQLEHEDPLFELEFDTVPVTEIVEIFSNIVA